MYVTFVAVLLAIMVALKLTGYILASWWVIFSVGVFCIIAYIIGTIIALCALSRAFSGKWFSWFR